MQIIDAHQHFWRYNEHTHAWISDEMSVLKRDFLPPQLVEVYRLHDVSGCVAVQADQSRAETDFLLDLADQYPFIKGVVGWIDICSSDLEDQLKDYTGRHQLKGFRHVVQDEPDDHFIARPDFQMGLEILGEHGYTYDILIYPRQMPAALRTIECLPHLKMVIDHIAKPNIKSGESAGWKEYMSKMAEHQNVYCKISGMVTEATWSGWSYRDFEPWLDVVFDVFGVDRIMFGSDWPVCKLAADYKGVLDIITQYISSFSKIDQKKIFGENAVKFYNL